MWCCVLSKVGVAVVVLCFAQSERGCCVFSEERMREGERRRNELYRQYYEELQRRYDTERPVDCSVIVVNKQQK